MRYKVRITIYNVLIVKVRHNFLNSISSQTFGSTLFSKLLQTFLNCYSRIVMRKDTLASGVTPVRDANVLSHSCPLESLGPLVVSLELLLLPECGQLRIASQLFHSHAHAHTHTDDASLSQPGRNYFLRIVDTKAEVFSTSQYWCGGIVGKFWNSNIWKKDKFKKNNKGN